MNYKAFRSARKKDATDYLTILSKLSITHSKIDFKESLLENQWGYKIEGIKVPVDLNSLRHIRPLGFSNLEIIIDLEIISNIDDWDKLNDPFVSLNFRSHMKGTNSLTGKTHYLSFHIDRHNGAKTVELHPLYHLQYIQNANAKPKDEFDHGESLQMDIPRMMHFPMELILGVSFVISNFSPKIYDKLIQDRRYVNLCKIYQERVWRPYINSLENFWLQNPKHWLWDPKLNCPYLV